jgi:rhodanese-related sulfurtransferase
MNWFLLLLGGLAAFLLIRFIRLTRPGISLEAAMAALKAGQAVLVDIREPVEWSAGVAKNAALLPFSDLRGPREKWRAFLEKNRGKQLLLYCHSGSRSGLAASLLRQEGRPAVNAGTLRDWDRAGWPICAPRGWR